LGSEKSTLVVISGYKFDKKAEDIGAFFQAITDASDKYSSLMQAGKLDEGAELLQKTRTKTISTFLGTATPGAGDITMTSSQIGTSIGQSDIFVIAAGSLNLGKTALPSSDKPSATTGIWTGDGGGINIFAVRDVNVNESRIMTFQGGDISIWSDQGDINAGRGSRTAVNAKPPRKVDIPGGGSTLVYTPPATGSGIRATHPTDKNLAGNVHLYAKGVIDAGEAGIFGKDLHIWAEKGVLNAANIAGIGSVVGVPKTTTGATNLGALSGAGTVATQGSQALSEASGGVAAQRTAQAAKMIEDIMMKWLDVKVIDFVQNDSVAAGDQGYNDTNENKHKGH
ncbi:MAG TPA: filamentous hemagglutinin family protein, partial [Dissulfurispiraceae bacterium]